MPDEPVVPTIVTVPASSSGSGASGRVTSEGHPIDIQVVPVWKVLAVRTLSAFINALLGSSFVTTFAPSLFNTHGFYEGAKVAVFSSGAIAGMALLRAGAELLAKWDQSHPQLSA